MNIVQVTKQNYSQFEDMIYWRVNGKERHRDIAGYKVPESIVDELDNVNLHLYSAVVDSRMVGWISLVYIPKVGKFNGSGHIFVDELWVESSYRSMGIAKSLMEKADALKIQLKCSGVRLYVSQNNTSAMKLYETCGYNYSGETHFMEK